MKRVLKIILLVTAILLYAACNYIIENNSEVVSENRSILNDKLEAELLVEATQQNLNTIALCEILEKKYVNDTIIRAVKQIKKEQKDIYNSLQSIARNNMILVPNTINIDPYKSLNTKKDSVIADRFIQQIQSNLDLQKRVLDSLIKESNDNKILLVAEENITKLKSNIKITEYTLERLK